MWIQHIGVKWLTVGIQEGERFGPWPWRPRGAAQVIRPFRSRWRTTRTMCSCFRYSSSSSFSRSVRKRNVKTMCVCAGYSQLFVDFFCKILRNLFFLVISECIKGNLLCKSTFTWCSDINVLAALRMHQKRWTKVLQVWNDMRVSN